MEKITVATKNPAKIDQIRGALASHGIVVVGVDESKNLPDVEETGQTPQENARIKAVSYAKYLGTAVLSMDNALYFDDLEGDPRQPGLHVRRIDPSNPGLRPSDEQLLEYYSSLTKELGGKIKARWEFGVCVAKPDGTYNETVIVSPRIFVESPSSSVIEGYPLESLQIDPQSGKYISEMSGAQKDAFWQERIGTPLYEFICSLE